MEWTSKGMTLQLPSGKVYKADLEDGLPYLSWEDIEPLRNVSVKKATDLGEHRLVHVFA